MASLAKEEGMLEGKLEAKQEVLLSLLHFKFGTLPETAIEKIKVATIDKIETWLINLMLKPSLDQILV
jgi:hypothetical protein